MLKARPGNEVGGGSRRPLSNELHLDEGGIPDVERLVAICAEQIVTANSGRAQREV